MIRNRIFLKTLAVFFLLEMAVNVVWPSVSYALTAGPTAPEATSFEPVDTTDMVNLATGDLAYNIPLLEVPGPSGGYPLSLSYHAGIQPNEEASWVGLGWTLNPGAITRNVNGFADDHNGVENTNRFYWAGGNREGLEVGVTAGISGVAGATASISISSDTYQGFGVGGSVGLSVGLKGSVGLNLSVGVDGYGNPHTSLGVGIGIGDSEKSALGLHLGVGINAGPSGISGYASGGVSVSYDKPGKSSDPSSKSYFLNKGGFGVLGASISSSRDGISTSFSGGGVSQVHNSRTNRISTSSAGFTLPLPFVSLGYSYQRYWIDETEYVNTFGALYNPKSIVSGGFDKKAFDSNANLDPDFEDPSFKFDPDQQLGGSFLSYDNYNVNAQGIGGSIRPYSFKNLIFRQNRKPSGSYVLKQFPYRDNIYQDNDFEFRFVSDFSNRYINTGGVINVGAPLIDPISPTFADDEKTGEAGTVSDGFADGHLVGSRHIEWYTNKQILGLDATKRPKDEGFIDCAASGFQRSSTGALGDQIGGFKITNESGVTYHFALPVYAHSEYQRSENITKTDGNTFNELYKNDPYAYTWYLTAITGPDFVDRGPSGTPDGILNEFDWGYWISLEYGKWTDSYAWRNPAQDAIRDLDQNFKNFSEGLKEVYYLDAIRSKTHTALFVKSIRDDGKSTVYGYRNITRNIITGVEDDYKKEIVSITKTGGFVPKKIKNTCSVAIWDFFDYQIKDKGEIEYYARPVSSLKLESVFLFNNDDLENIPLNKSNGMEYSQNWPYPWSIQYNASLSGDLNCDFTTKIFNQHLYQNVLDVYDLASIQSQITQKSLKSIVFKTSNNSLVPGTENSFDYTLVKAEIPSQNSSDYTRKSKLTLEEISFRGKGGADLMPPTKFGYDLADPLNGAAAITSLSLFSRKYRIQQPNTELIAGDLVKITTQNVVSYGLVESVSSSYFDVRVIGGGNPATNATAYWSQTKNPPYNKDAYDLWGMYKSDFKISDLDVNENYARSVSALSKRSLDVWSLRSIQSPVGSIISVEYEPDEYKSEYLDEVDVPWIESLTVSDQPGYLDIQFPTYYDVTNNFHQGDTVDFFVYTGFRHGNLNNEKVFDVYTFAPYSSSFDLDYAKSIIASVQSSGMRIYNATLYGHLISDHPDFDCKEYEVLGGNVVAHKNVSDFGGGVRVRSIGVNVGNSINTTVYDYHSGKSSYTPLTSNNVKITFPESAYYDHESKKIGWISYLARFLNGQLIDLLAVARDIPPPGVIYSKVQVREYKQGLEVPGMTEYEFETFSKNFFGVFASHNTQVKAPHYEILGTFDNLKYDEIKTRDIAFKDLTDQTGKLKRITLFDDRGNKINETINHYLYDQSSVVPGDQENKFADYEDRMRGFNQQGMIQETMVDVHFYSEYSPYEILGTITRRHRYPSVQTGQTTTNYKTGITVTSETLGFDFYSGKAVKVSNTDGYGNTYVTETVPAYRIYEAMGPGTRGGYNMLDQEASSYSYKADPGTLSKLGLVSGSVQTWSDRNTILQHPELNESVTLSTFGTAVAGLHTATSPETGAHLNTGDRFEFSNNGTIYQARIDKATLKQNLHYWEYSIRLIGKTYTGSSLTNLTVNKITVPRKRASYSYIGDDTQSLRPDGLHMLTNNELPAFTAWNAGDPTPAGWQKNSEITLYDVHSHALEAMDINEQFAATRMTPDQTRVTSTIANARYQDFTYSGIEEVDPQNNFSLGNNLFISGSATRSTGVAHTGLYSVATASDGFIMEGDITPDKKYVVSVWSTNPSATIQWSQGNGTLVNVALSPAKQAGNWYLLSGTFTPTQPHIKVVTKANNTPTNFDDFRIHPFDAAMISYVYNNWGELSHILDNNNLYTEYKYDGMGRLTSTHKETFSAHGYGTNGIVKVSEVAYNYGAKNPYMINLTFTATGGTGEIRQTNCGTGNCPTVSAVSIPQGGSYTFELKELCQTPKLQTLMIDNSIITMVNSTQLLPDGTKVTVNGKFITLEGVIGTHTIRADFYDYSGIGYSRCHLTAQGCQDGTFDYYYLDACGNPGPITRVSSVNQIPAGIISNIPPGGCPVTSGNQCGISQD